jgi:DNA-binding HxlR family transcriptional regulator
MDRLGPPKETPSSTNASDRTADRETSPEGPSARKADVEEKFRQFSQQSVAFVRDVRESIEVPASLDPLHTAAENLEVARTVFGKWSMEILIALYAHRAVGFEDLRRHLEGISARVLSRKLKALEARGIVTRTIIDGRPPRVQYALTEEGLTVAHLGEPVFLYVRVRAAQIRPAISAAD